MSYGHVHRRNAAPPEAQVPVVVEFERDFNLVYQSAQYEVLLVRHRHGQPATAGTLSVQVRLQGFDGSDPLFGPAGGFAVLAQPRFADGESTAWLSLADLWYADPERSYPHFMSLRIEPGAGFEVGVRGNGSVPVHVVAAYPNW